jgi:SAM-dependent methyltransferase
VAKAAARFTEAELLARADAFNRAADVYWRDVMAEPSARRHVLNKPVSSVVDTPAMLYRLGLLLSELHLGLGHVVLDFGAGSCWLASCLNRLGCHTIAVDVSPAALDVGRELFRIDPRHRPELDPRFLAYDGHRLPLPDASVDRIACFDAFHHIPNQDEVLGEFFRVLRPGGRAVLAEPGEGHSHSELSSFEADRCGVLENELDVQDLDRRARKAGFTRVSLKPYPGPDSISLSPADYVRVMEGDPKPFPMATLSRSLRDFFLVTLAKGDEVVDSRRPGHLHAEIAEVGPRGAALRGGPGDVLRVALRVKNAGDTLWLHRWTEAGGYVVLSGNLIDATGHRVRSGFFRIALPHDVPAGDSATLDAEIPLPAEAGRYEVEFDLVDEHVMWFSQAGSPTTRVAVEVAAHAAGATVAADDLRARIESLAPQPLRALPGTRVRAAVRLTNTGRQAWTHASEPRPNTVSVAGHLLDGDGRMHARDVLHQPLPRDIAPGETVDVDLALRGPLEPGAYRLKLDLVLEHVCWFEQRGSTPLDLAIEVMPGVPASDDPGVLLATIEAPEPLPSRVPPAAALVLRLIVRNIGNTRWLAEVLPEGGHVALGAHLLRADRSVAVLDYARARLPRDLGPGETVEVDLAIKAPAEKGGHVIEIDLVHEGRAWFAALGSPTLRIPLEVV